jgi:NADH-quinone oxidoreductase subunit M
VLLGVFSWNLLALQGAVMTMLAHGISAAALFMIAGALQERLHTREMGNMGGLWAAVPRLSAMALFFAIASLGLPGLGNFLGEFLVFLGAFKVSMTLTALAALVMILAPVYALIIIQKAFHGPLPHTRPVADFGRRDMIAMGLLAIASVWLGLHPHLVLSGTEPSLQQAMQSSAVMESTDEQ